MIVLRLRFILELLISLFGILPLLSWHASCGLGTDRLKIPAKSGGDQISETSVYPINLICRFTNLLQEILTSSVESVYFGHYWPVKHYYQLINFSIDNASSSKKRIRSI
jgi:hypothetical protein